VGDAASLEKRLRIFEYVTGKYKPRAHLGLDTRIVEIFEPVAHFTSFPATHEIGAARDIENCQIVLDMLENVNERTWPGSYPFQPTAFNLE